MYSLGKFLDVAYMLLPIYYEDNLCIVEYIYIERERERDLNKKTITFTKTYLRILQNNFETR